MIMNEMMLNYMLVNSMTAN